MNDADTIDNITDHFGGDIIQDGILNRPKLRTIIFSDDAARLHLEKILHPRIREEVRKAVSRAVGAYIIIVVPLLVEKAQYSFINRILVVDCEELIQVKRVMKRSSLTDVEVTNIMCTQANRQERLKVANDIIINNDDLPSLLKQVRIMHDKYIQISLALKNC